MSVQSPRSSTRDSFETPPWESWEKVPFGCGSRGVTQRILYGGRWWLPLSPGRDESSESKVTRGLSQHQMDVEWVLTNLGLVLDAKRILTNLGLVLDAEWLLTNLGLVLDAGSCNNIIVSLPSLIPGLLARPSYPLLVLEVGSASKFHISAIQHTWTLKWVQQRT
jgi:hypothetical protein